MPRPGRLFADDEELGKKDDNYRPEPSNSTAWVWITPNGASRWRRKRIAILFCVLILGYFFISNLPDGLEPAAYRVDSRDPYRTLNGSPVRKHLTNLLPKKLSTETTKDVATDVSKDGTSLKDSDAQAYDGPIKYYNLASSLHGIAKLDGYREINKNVLFAAGNVKSASKVIPLACDMSRWSRNHVHFALMGREDTSLEELRKVNGIGKECEVYWHDARPDFSTTSTDRRMELSVRGAFRHFHSYMHPQVILVDGSTDEQLFFIKAARDKAADSHRALIELPSNAPERLMWMTRLDSGSLRAWHDTSIDILIQASGAVSGSLMRLLRSIETADYSGFRRPHLTIELSESIPSSTREFLSDFIWPPLDPSQSPHNSALTLRHRIQSAQLTPLEASTRFLESFYPIRSSHSHVLILSPNVELSPQYFHYLMHNTLEYRYSSYGSSVKDAKDLMGLSLILPSLQLDGETQFEPPGQFSKGPPAAFRWQAPDAFASLIFGSKWMELHSFLTSRLSSSSKRIGPTSKLISTKLPGWTEFALELMRARGYSFLYPQFPKQATTAKVHTELQQMPEEFVPKPSSSLDQAPGEDAPRVPEDLFLMPLTTSESSVSKELPLTSLPLTSLLPFDADLPELISLPILSYKGDTIDASRSTDLAKSYAETFRTTVGGCKPDSEPRRLTHSASDLFCWGTPDEDHSIADSPSSSDTLASQDQASKAKTSGMDYASGVGRTKQDDTSRTPTNQAASKPKGRGRGRYDPMLGRVVYEEDIRALERKKLARMRAEATMHLERQKRQGG